MPSSRRLEREAQRNLEVLWLTGRLAPDFKTIADFRRDNGPAIKATCRQFVLLCRRLDLFSDSLVAIDGSKFKAVDTTHHLIVAHEVTNATSDRAQLAPMSKQAQEAPGRTALTVLANRGYFAGRQIVACAVAGMMPYVPKPYTSGAKADGRFGKQDFVYLSKQDAYRCPAGQTMKWWFNRVDENGTTLRHYWTTKCPECPIKAQCTPAKMRRVTRWEHEGVLDAMQKRLDQVPQAMILRRQTVEHPFGTIKAWMGATHFLTRTLKRVGTEMSLQVLAYNMKRVIAILGVRPLMEAIRA